MNLNWIFFPLFQDVILNVKIVVKPIWQKSIKSNSWTKMHTSRSFHTLIKFLCYVILPYLIQSFHANIIELFHVRMFLIVLFLIAQGCVCWCWYLYYGWSPQCCGCRCWPTFVWQVSLLKIYNASFCTSEFRTPYVLWIS